MNKKIVSAITLGLVSSQLIPYVAYANPNINTENVEVNTNISNGNKTSNLKSNIDWEKEYPNLINPDKKDIKPIVFSPEVVLELDSYFKTLDKLEKDFNINELQELFDKIFELNKSISVEDVSIHKDYDQIDYIMYKATYIAFTNLKEGTERNNFFVKLADDMYLSAVKRHNSGIKSTLMEEYGAYWGFKLREYFNDEKTEKTLLYLGSMLIGVSEKPLTPGDSTSIEDFDPYISEDELPSNLKPDPSLEPDGEPEEFPELSPELPDEIIPDDGDIVYPDDNGNSSNDSDSSTVFTEEYNQKGNSCYKTTTTYDYEGNVLSVKESNVNKGFCNIYDYEIIDGNTWNTNNNGDIALEVWESLGQNELNKLSNNSIHFTLNKNNEKPYYYDSGIRVSIDNTATYTQIKDVLTQISLKLDNSYVIEDNNKLLFIADGKPLVVRDKQNEYTQSEIESLLNSFTSVGLKIDTINQLSSESIEAQINTGNLSEITINGDTVSLTNSPILEGSILQLPIEEICKNLGSTVQLKDNTLTINKNDTVITYEIGTKNININGNKKILSTVTQNKDGIIYGEMTLVSKELGYELSFDTLKSKIEFN